MTDQLIIRYSPFGKIQHATVEPEQLKASFPDIHRTKRIHHSPIGDIREVEATGRKRRSHVCLSLVGGLDRFGREIKPGASNGTRIYIKLLEHKKHVRVLHPDDVWALRSCDDQIAGLQEQLEEARNARERRLQSAWRRATPFGLDEIEQRAQEAIR